MFTKLIKGISKITDYNIICVPLLLIICTAVSSDTSEFIVLAAVSVLTALVIPKISNFLLEKQEKYTFNVCSVSNAISYFIGFIILLFLNIDLFMELLFLAYSLNSAILLILLKRNVNVSVNAFYLCGLIAGLILSFGPYSWPAGILYSASLWPNIYLKKYLPYEEINSGIVSFITVPAIMYILAPYGQVYEIIWITASFIIFPIIYELAEYYQIELDGYRSELIFALTFFIFAYIAFPSLFFITTVFLTSLAIGVFRGMTC